ncbi:glycosyltransferase [Paracoccus aurantiacus]|uniref:Glycosyltransferase n=1 Tax=Paracoccus aurantiacus TaxID=2599412 RepID=A0A5C6S2J1_9RHOB|nr:glycosyltransferase [Paracoccus aurantiacus]TXB69058.1 glycosyltransferase [Paracoccus aurantiacus]
MIAKTAATDLPVPIRPGVKVPDPGTEQATLGPRDLRPLGQILLEDGAVSHGDLLKATVMRGRQNVPLGQILLAQGWVTEESLTRALTRQWRTSAVDPLTMPPDSRLIDRLGPAFCLKNAILPWRRVGGVTFIATSRPESFQTLQTILPTGYGPVRMLLCSESAIHQAIISLRMTSLTRRAETSVAAGESCRSRNEGSIARFTILLLSALAFLAVAAPVGLLSVLTGWAMLTLLAGTILKLAAFKAVLRQKAEDAADQTLIATGLKTQPEMLTALPVISVMVPLFHESDVAGKLLGRLARLDYPRELTDILLVVEATDPITSAALKGVRLPHWVRVVTVPPGPVQTKPRALNYALNFCRGDIVGVWDAEDRPDPDQLHKIARGFAFAAPDVACLQGQLDYFNPRSNWLARCFTIEYASWFRANLPGIAKLGMIVPLGGTTLFFRRDVLEQLGGWDAWNVTEDADLGVRLARRGWRTELVDTTTDEEANCRALPWIKQRSRWLKGYAMTWGVHMRQPRKLWQELGPKRFIGFQIQFLGTISQYLLAPVLWSFWALSLGLPHLLREPLAHLWGGNAIAMLFTLFVASELIGMAINLWAVRGEKHRHLRIWVPLMHLYFPLGCLAGWKAIYEVVTNPFYWDKTAHGVFDETEVAETLVAVPDDARIVPMLGDIGNTKGSSFVMADISAMETAAPAPPLSVVEDDVAHALASADASGSDGVHHAVPQIKVVADMPIGDRQRMLG